MQLLSALSARGIMAGIPLTQYGYDIEKSIFILKHLVLASSIGVIVDFNCNNRSQFLHLVFIVFINKIVYNTKKKKKM